mmetsp:Transcript_107725/g.313557  ORF Transcript_107725/g.313557 Transcript_107725/m.313557 type:complete len:218 (+) Transcript_107725:271-924(+)|eukprot:CAMPEP_0119505348 /NCGR_PEP_ID=MMETSP1344-20130328/25911_1 /TAXON_ID=236787 /ORGANISM="Florenciella parvula, Strain CCMP2471" /LENGTH=217 /DNA_ID=CAMNT_0007541793 /DNA_START=141 /DNA_END=794 /DNA_ORIENTATION=+
MPGFHISRIAMLLLAASGVGTAFIARSPAAPRLSVVKTTRGYERPSVRAQCSRSLTTRAFSRSPLLMAAGPTEVGVVAKLGMEGLTVAGAVAVATIAAVFKVQAKSDSTTSAGDGSALAAETKVEESAEALVKEEPVPEPKAKAEPASAPKAEAKPEPEKKPPKVEAAKGDEKATAGARSGEEIAQLQDDFRRWAVLNGEGLSLVEQLEKWGESQAE